MIFKVICALLILMLMMIELNGKATTELPEKEVTDPSRGHHGGHHHHHHHPRHYRKLVHRKSDDESKVKHDGEFRRFDHRGDEIDL